MTDPFSRPPDQLGFVVPAIERTITEWLQQGVGFYQASKLHPELIQPADDEASAYRDFVAGQAGRALAGRTQGQALTPIAPH